MKRLLFVCPSGHIFRSLVKLKNGRVRLCPDCHKAGAVGPYKGIGAARSAASGSAVAQSCIQIFTRGRIHTINLKEQKKAA